MKYIKLKIEVNKEYFEILERELEDDGFGQSLVEDFAEQPVISLYFSDDEDGMYEIARAKESIWSVIQFLEDQGNHEASYGFSVSESVADDQEWLYKWQENFKPTKVSERIVVKPAWEEYDAAEGELVIEIDPGISFGSGTHATTAMCLKALEKYVRPSDSVLDVGCGSGILAIGAALLGAKEALGIEIDQEAVEIAKANVELNHLSDRISIQNGDLTRGTDYIADIVVANLLSDLVVTLTPDVAKHLKDGGLYISSGILEEQYEQVRQSIEEAGFTIEEKLQEGEWVAIVAKRK